MVDHPGIEPACYLHRYLSSDRGAGSAGIPSLIPIGYVTYTAFIRSGQSEPPVIGLPVHLVRAEHVFAVLYDQSHPEVGPAARPAGTSARPMHRKQLAFVLPYAEVQARVMAAQHAPNDSP